MFVDTTVWVDHLRRGDDVLVGLLEHLQVTVHPFVVGELGCGHIRNRPIVLAALSRLPAVPVVEHADVLAFIEANKLMGRGLGWVDINLLVSADAAGEKLLTRDRRLKGAAESLGWHRAEGQQQKRPGLIPDRAAILQAHPLSLPRV